MTEPQGGTALETLARLTAVTRGRVPADLTERASQLRRHAAPRLWLTPTTVVALAGTSGAGRSSLLAALAGDQPTTANPHSTAGSMAVSFGAAEPELLTMLGVEQHREIPAPAPGLENVILIDLVAHDSAELDQVLPLIDQLVWVLDPHRYADLIIHRDHLRPLAAHREVTSVVLNQVDRLSATELTERLNHLYLLLATDGLPGIPVTAISSTTGQGIDELRSHLADAAARKAAARSRSASQLRALVDEFQTHCPAPPPLPTAEAIQTTLEAIADVAGAADIVGRVIAHHGALATRWPLLSRRPKDTSPQPEDLPDSPTLEGTQPDLVLSQLADQAAAGLGPGWRQAMTEGLLAERPGLRADLDQAMATTVDARSDSWIYQLIRICQWLLLASALLGLGWWILDLLAGAVGASFILAMLLGIGLGAVATTIAARLFVDWRSRQAAAHARRVLGRAVAAVGRRHVLAPLSAEHRHLTEARQLIGKLRDWP